MDSNPSLSGLTVDLIVDGIVKRRLNIADLGILSRVSREYKRRVNSDRVWKTILFRDYAPAVYQYMILDAASNSNAVKMLNRYTQDVTKHNRHVYKRFYEFLYKNKTRLHPSYLFTNGSGFLYDWEQRRISIAAVKHAVRQIRAIQCGTAIYLLVHYRTTNNVVIYLTMTDPQTLLVLHLAAIGPEASLGDTVFAGNAQHVSLIAYDQRGFVFALDSDKYFYFNATTNQAKMFYSVPRSFARVFLLPDMILVSSESELRTFLLDRSSLDDQNPSQDAIKFFLTNCIGYRQFHCVLKMGVPVVFSTLDNDDDKFRAYPEHAIIFDAGTGRYFGSTRPIEARTTVPHVLNAENGWKLVVSKNDDPYFIRLLFDIYQQHPEYRGRNVFVHGTLTVVTSKDDSKVEMNASTAAPLPNVPEQTPVDTLRATDDKNDMQPIIEYDGSLGFYSFSYTGIYYEQLNYGFRLVSSKNFSN